MKMEHLSLKRKGKGREQITMSAKPIGDDIEDLPELEEVSPDSVTSHPENLQKYNQATQAKVLDYTKTAEQETEQKASDADQLYKKMAKAFTSEAQNEQQKLQKSADVIRPNPQAPSNAVVAEVKAVFEQKNLAGNPQFLQKVMTNKTLQRGMSNSRLMKIIKEMETNPGVVKQHAQDAEFTAFLKEYMQLISGEFKESDFTPPVEQPAMKEVSRKEVRDSRTSQQKEIEALLAEPKVAELIRQIQAQGRLDFYELIRRDPELAQKARRLAECGFFQMQR